MSEPRFYIVSVHGSSIPAGGRHATSYSVLDRAQNHAEVFSQYASVGQGAPRRLARCVRECERRNALDAAGCAA